MGVQYVLVSFSLVRREKTRFSLRLEKLNIPLLLQRKGQAMTTDIIYEFSENEKEKQLQYIVFWIMCFQLNKGGQSKMVVGIIFSFSSFLLVE